MRKFLSLLLLLLSVSFTIHAANIRTGSSVTINEPVEGNIYIAAGSIIINAPIGQDLLAAGGEIEVNDTIRGDALVAGGEIRFNSVIGEDLRVFGGEIKIFQDVLGDLLVTGGEVEIAPSVTIYGDLIMAGGSIKMGGKVIGTSEISGGKVDFSGTASGTVSIKAANLSVEGQINGKAKLVTERMSLGDDARFTADVVYYNGEGEVDFTGKLVGGATATYDPTLKTKLQEMDWEGMRRGLFLLSVYWALASLILIILGVWLLSSWLEHREYHLPQNIWNNLGLGFLFFLAVPAAIFGTFITIIGIPVGLILLIAFLILIGLSKVIASVVAAYVLQEEWGQEWPSGRLMLVAIGFYLALQILGFIPFLGSLINLLVVLIAFGTIIQIIRNPDRTAPPEDIAL